jgi:hypothetical protein
VRHREFAQGAGELSREEFIRFLTSTCTLLKTYSKSGSIHFVCMDWKHLDELLTAGREVYTELKNIVTWFKSEPPRDCRRPFGLSYAAMADCSSIA